MTRNFRRAKEFNRFRCVLNYSKLTLSFDVGLQLPIDLLSIEFCDSCGADIQPTFRWIRGPSVPSQALDLGRNAVMEKLETPLVKKLREVYRSNHSRVLESAGGQVSKDRVYSLRGLISV